METIYNFSVKDIDLNDVSLEKYKNKVLLIVNVASYCGLTYQYKSLEDTYRKYKDEGFEILGFPCNQFALQEPGSNEEIKNLDEGDEGILILNQTPFYGESGGQVGDSGAISSGENLFKVCDVQKKLGNLFLHYGKMVKGSLKINESLELKINLDQRNNVRA